MTRSRRILVVLALAVAASGCRTIREAFAPPPQVEPSGREGWLVYVVGGLRFEAPAGWSATGGVRHVKLEGVAGEARLEVSMPDSRFADEKACLAAAGDALDRAGGLERVRRHPTTFGGARALTLEGDTQGWHVWAWAACVGGTQYQVFFTAKTPAPAEVIEAYRALAASARIGGEA